MDDDKGKPKKIIVYDRIKDNVIVRPQADILYARGFLPRPGMQAPEEKEGDPSGLELVEGGLKEPASDDPAVLKENSKKLSSKLDSNKSARLIEVEQSTIETSRKATSPTSKKSDDVVAL